MNPFTMATPTFQNPNGLSRLLASIANSTARPVEVIVMDNGCTISSLLPPIPIPNSSETIPVSTQLPGRNLGVAAAWNWAAKLAKTDDLIICNDDVTFGPETLLALVSAPPTAGMVFLKDRATGYAGGYTCFNWRRWFRERVGEFDENFFPAYYEDSDMTERFVKSGLPGEAFHCVDATITHESAQRGRLPWVQEGFNRNYWRFLEKWGHDPGQGGHSPDKGYKTPYNR